MDQTPFLNARRSWNEHIGGVIQEKRVWQFVAITCLFVTAIVVAGALYIGGQSKFVPYVVQVDKLGQVQAAGVATKVATDVPKVVVEAQVATWLTNARMVTVDADLQKKAVFSVYALLAAKDPAAQKMNEWFNSTPASNPFKRAEKELVSAEVKSIIGQSPTTWQIDWIETVRERGGQLVSQTPWRALVTVYRAEASPDTTEEQMRSNPLSLYVRDFSWSRVQ